MWKVVRGDGNTDKYDDKYQTKEAAEAVAYLLSRTYRGQYEFTVEKGEEND